MNSVVARVVSGFRRIIAAGRSHAAVASAAAAVRFEGLEDRRMMAAPDIDFLPDVDVPAGRSLIIPVTGRDTDGDFVNYKVKSSNNNIRASFFRRTNTFIRMTVQNFGVMEFQLLGEVAPKTVDVIRGLVHSEFYNNLQFHRVIKSFMVQGGDLAGTGSGFFPYKFEDEYQPAVVFSGFGQLAMANSGNDTNGSQFFITTSQPRHLDYNHTIFGQLVRGKSVLQAIENTPTNISNNKPTTPVIVQRVQIVQNKSDAVLRVTAPSGQSGRITVIATDDDGNVTKETFSAAAKSDSANNPAPFVVPIPDMVVPINQPIQVNLTGHDDGPLFWDGNFIGQGHNAQISPDGTKLFIFPAQGFRGQIQLRLGVKASSAAMDPTNNPLVDEQIVTIAVGEQPLKSPTGLVARTVTGRMKDLAVATFKDADPNGKASEYTATIYWGDGSQPTAGKITRNASGLFTVTGKHTFPSEGTYPLYVAVKSATGVTANIRAEARVADAPLTATPVPVVGYAGQALTNIVVATFKDADPRGILSDFTARIIWGDGTTTDGVIENNPGGGYRVKGTHTYATAGAKALRVTIIDKGGSTAAVNQQAKIGRTTLVVNADNNRTIGEQSDPAVKNYTVLTGNFTDTGAGTSWTGLIDWGDGSAPEPLVINQAAKTFEMRHNYPDSGTYRVTVVITDQTGNAANSGNDTFDVTVLNVAPTAQFTGGDSTGVRGQARRIKFTATDVSPADRDHGFTYTVDWGDGSGAQSLALKAEQASHVYSTAGTFTIKLRATDKDGSASTEVTRSITIVPAQIQTSVDNPNLLDLVVGGTSAGDFITVSPAEQGKVKVDMGGQSLGAFNVSGKVRVLAGQGNDTIDVVAGVSHRLELYGEAGNDTIRGSGGDDVISGGAGDDRLFGAGGRDIVIGGFGQDLLNGGGADDLLIGNFTKHEADSKALGALLAEWTRPTLYNSRLSNIIEGDGRNGEYFLGSGGVSADFGSDSIIGDAGTDAFFATTAGSFGVDKIKDTARGERVTIS